MVFKITINRKTQSLTAWCKELNKTYQTVYCRITHYSMSIIKALELSPPKPFIDKMLDKIDYHPESGCWNWTGCVNLQGYGRIIINHKEQRVHRVMYQYFYGDIPEDKPFILHRCDNPKCCSPKHLYAGNNSDNMQDRIKHGKNTWKWHA